jgi:hypothetical protein
MQLSESLWQPRELISLYKEQCSTAVILNLLQLASHNSFCQRTAITPQKKEKKPLFCGEILQLHTFNIILIIIASC